MMKTKSSVVPQRPSRLRDTWRWRWSELSSGLEAKTLCTVFSLAAAGGTAFYPTCVLYIFLRPLLLSCTDHECFLHVVAPPPPTRFPGFRAIVQELLVFDKLFTSSDRLLSEHSRVDVQTILPVITAPACLNWPKPKCAKMTYLCWGRIGTV